MELSLLNLPSEIILQISAELDVQSLSLLIQTTRRLFYVLDYLLYTKALTHERERGVSVLVWAARENRVSTVEKILARGINNIAHKDRFGALYHASESGHEHVVRLLLATVPDPDIDRPELRCIAHAEPEVVINLLGAGMNPYIDIVSTALDGAARSGHLNVVRMLIESGVDLQANCEALPAAAAAGHDTIVQLLLASGMDRHETAVAYALRASAHAGYTSTVEILLLAYRVHGAPPSQALENALDAGHESVVKAILSAAHEVHGFDTEMLSRMLFPATRSGLTGIVQLLLSAIESPPSQKELVKLLQNAARYGQVSILRLLLDSAEGYPAEDVLPAVLVAGVETGTIETVQLLLEKGAAQYSNHLPKETPILVASRRGHAAITDLFINRGADMATCDAMGWTALHYAAARGHFEVARVLLRAGIDVSIRNVIGETALHLAANRGATSVSHELVKYGIGINIRNNRQYTALHMAAGEGHEEIVWLLIHAGADISAQNPAGWTPIDLAAIRGHASITGMPLCAGGLDDSTDNVQSVLASMAVKTSSHTKWVSRR